MRYSSWFPFADLDQNLDQVSQIVALGFGLIGLVTFGEECQQIQWHGLIVKTIDDSYATAFPFPAAPPSELSCTGGGLHQVTRFGVDLAFLSRYATSKVKWFGDYPTNLNSEPMATRMTLPQ